MFENIEWWKINTGEEWINFLLLAVPSFLLLYTYYLVLLHNRSEAAAVDRVDRRFKLRAEKGSRIYKNVGIRIGDKEIVVDNLLIDNHGILCAHTFGRGMTVYGDVKDEFWRIKDLETNELVINPLYEVENIVHSIQTTLAHYDVYGLNVDGIAIFADNFGNEPSIYVGQAANVFGFKYLKPFFAKRNESKVTIKDPNKVADLLEKFFFEVPPKENYSQRKRRIKEEKRRLKAEKKASKAK